MTVELHNFTPFPNLRYSGADSRGREFGVFMVKVAWDITQADKCMLSEEQEPFAFKDEYHGEVNTSSVRYPSDFVPFKPRTDISLNATAFAPEGRPAKRWLVGVRVLDESGILVCEKVLQISGPRQWVPKWKRRLDDEETKNWRDHRHLFEGWELSEPVPIDRLDIRYEYAFGGMIEKGLDADSNLILEAYDYNPIGCGLLDKEWSDHTVPHPAPQIEDPADPVTEPYKLYVPQGYGPIAPAYLPRRSLGGTYDRNWLDNIHPNWPPDYEYEFHNSGPDGLRAERLLREGLRLELVNLHPRKPHWHICLPSPDLVCAVDQTPDSMNNPAEGEVVRNPQTPPLFKMPLDSVFLEIDQEHQSDPRIFEILRMPFHRLNTLGITLLKVGEEEREAGNLELSLAPTPDDVAVEMPSEDETDGAEEEASA